MYVHTIAIHNTYIIFEGYTPQLVKQGGEIKVGPVDHEVCHHLHERHHKVDTSKEKESKVAKPDLHERDGWQMRLLVGGIVEELRPKGECHKSGK